MNVFMKSVEVVATACGGNPVSATMLMILFYAMFNYLEASVERLIFGERLEHWLDPVFICAFMIYTAFVVWACAAAQIGKSL